MERLRLTARVCTLALAAAALLAFGFSSSVQADSCDTSIAGTNIVICLSVPNVDLATQGTGPYGELTITGSGTSWEVVAKGLNGFVFGDGGILDLNLSAAAGTGTLTAITGFTQQVGGGNIDGFGNFNFVVDDGAGFASPYTTFTLDFTTSNSVTLTTLLALNSKNADGAAHMALATNTACSGFAANTGADPQTGTSTNAACTAVPEPATLTLVGSALVSLGMMGRRKWMASHRAAA